MVASVGSQSNIYALLQAQRAQQAQQTQSVAFPPTDSSDSSDDTDDAEVSGPNGQDGSVGAGGPVPNLLSSTTLASLLGLQTVNGQVQGGASGAELNLPQITLPSGMDPTALLGGSALLALQAVGA